MMRIRNIDFLYAVMALLLVFTLPACEKDDDVVDDMEGFDTWDDDNDGLIDDTEFNAAFDDTEYYDNWDIDSDGFLHEDEWNTGLDTYFTGYDEADDGTITDWDGDGDGVLSEDEFEDGVFGFYDDDDDDVFDEVEFDNWFDSFDD